jgi:HEAT repeat protein
MNQVQTNARQYLDELRTCEPSQRSRIVEQLVGMPAQWVCEGAEALLSEPSEFVRVAAVQVLSRLDCGVEGRARLLLQDPSEHVRYSCVYYLKPTSLEARAALIEALSDRVERVRLRAIVQLDQSDAPEVREALIKLLESTSWRERWWASLSLTQIGTVQKQVLDTLEALAGLADVQDFDAVTLSHRQTDRAPISERNSPDALHGSLMERLTDFPTTSELIELNRSRLEYVAQRTDGLG